MKSIQLAVILAAISIALPVIADRPAMSERAKPAPVPAAATVAEPPAEPAAAMQTRSETVHSGDLLEIQPGETIPVQAPDFPRRGMSMERVQNELGEPLTISPAVGTPPITTWSYPDRKVFFEHRKVIHAVATN